MTIRGSIKKDSYYYDKAQEAVASQKNVEALANGESSKNGEVPGNGIYVTQSSGRLASLDGIDVIENGGVKPALVHREGSLVYETADGQEEVTLMQAKHERIPMKDFSAEVRATLDVEKFINQKEVCFVDIHETNLEAIMKTLTHKLIDLEEPDCTEEDVISALFTHDSATPYRGVRQLSKTIQGTSSSDGGFDYDQSWICAMCTLPALATRHVAIGRLKTPANFGRSCQEVVFVILVLAPTKEKGTKTGLETGRTFATIFADMEFRQNLLDAKQEDFKELLVRHTKELAGEQGNPSKKALSSHNPFEQEPGGACNIGQGLLADIRRRAPHYWSDYKDGVIGPKALSKLASTTMFLYVACLLPDIALGVLNYNNTHGKLDVKKVIVSQTFGGLVFGLIGGQPLIVLLTTAPLALYTKIIYSVAEDFDLDFYALYGWVGIWNCFFLLIYSITGASKLMQWSSRSTEEIFALFISIAFTVDGIKAIAKNFDDNYWSCNNLPSVVNCSSLDNTSLSYTVINNTYECNVYPTCLRENSLLYLLLALGTLWLGLFLYNSTQTPFLTAGKRELLADYALPVSVLLFSFFGSYVFKDVKSEKFKFNAGWDLFQLCPFGNLPIGGIFAAAGLGFSLSLLFFMDQNISSAMVNSPQNKLKKGCAYHLDLLVVAIVNGVLSVFCLPWVHAALPHSPLHVKALADIEERVDHGHVYQLIVKVRETRLTAIISHVLIGVSLLMLPIPLTYIPPAVLDGLFLYVAITALYGNQMYERLTLLFTEQSAYPPNHYIRNVPQRKIHTFTAMQLFQLVVLCAVGFNNFAYLKMVFPILLMLLMPIRHKIMPKLVENKYLKHLDSNLM